MNSELGDRPDRRKAELLLFAGGSGFAAEGPEEPASPGAPGHAALGLSIRSSAAGSVKR